MNKIIKNLLCLTLAALTLFSTSSCFYFGFSPDYDGTPEDIYSCGLISEDMFLVAEGDSLKTLGGEVVTLRGVNLGGLFVTENWMNAIFKQTYTENGNRVRTYDKLISETFIKRFGEEKAKALWEEYRSNYISDEDFKLMKDMGINVIRLPITYMTVDFDAITDYSLAGDYDFSLVDAIIEKAASYGIYTILDLHGAYGSQNGADHSGEVKLPTDFYSNEEMMQLTVDLWRAMAEHYKGNAAVAAYDILNEPSEHKEGGGTEFTTTRHWDFMDRLYDAIRQVDKDHVVIFESCWTAVNIPNPGMYGWQNCMYSFHHYSNQYGDDASLHNATVDAVITSVKAMNFGVPIYMGEFTCYGNKEQWEYTLDAFNKAGWSWTSWTYKIHKHGMDHWGVVNVTSKEKQIDVYNDSYEHIFEAFSSLKTQSGNTRFSYFGDGESLFEVIKKYATAK